MPRRNKETDDYENLHVIKFIYYNFENDRKNSKGQLTVRYVPLTINTKARILDLGNTLITEGKTDSNDYD